MQDPTDDGHRHLDDLARRHGVSRDAALAVLRALAAGGGTMAQFSHPELGGMGQWSQGGMAMVGDMFNHDLKRRVDALCADLAALLRAVPPPAPGGSARDGRREPPRAATTGPGPPARGDAWWPAELGTPSASGAQNGTRYATFPAARRLAIRQQDGRVSLHDTGEHRITGVSQQQGGGRPLAFSTEAGPVRLEDLRPVGAEDAPHPPPAGDPVPAGGGGGGDPLAVIERLAELRRKGVLTEEEFVAKKAELLGRL